MSYDLFVFDTEHSPRTVKALESWYMEQTGSEESGFDPAVLTARLQTWFREMQTEFPAMNGPASPPDIEERIDSSGDYNMMPASVMVSFGWSQAVQAGRRVFASAERIGLGLYDPQSSEPKDGWYWPMDGKLEPMKDFSDSEPKSWFGKLFRRG